MKEHRIVGLFALAIAALCIAGVATAQTPQPWDTNVLRWSAPTACSTGEALAQCPLTGYVVERSSSGTGTFAQLSIVASSSTTYTHTSAAAGVNCYRVIATSARGNSTPSNVACIQNTAPPVGPPNPPTNLQFVVPLTTGANVSPAYRILADGSRSSPLYALVPVGSECSGPIVFNYRGKAYRRVTVTPAHLVGTSDPRNLAAPCA